ncbi:ABC transporter permease [Halobacillus karajensis]|uniref:ABC-type exoprotein transport system, permease component n=1 Tax=Halobacillus karajensis TaxID=195088 RepID=A0A059NZK9_9BACI|nr:ABC transporter permease [Halobacillus karajensis]CDQ21103.1 putative ABC-type exoprotein transport system, permease component [Halobacillus karajensis]CDQ24833.1 putative ABC-type exoprotein transport system, permease component [Halobacillus karajensis]CDQ28807.1 putative ABC-type exoprotein transport system, permease component [Halobacillus karajensis]
MINAKEFWTKRFSEHTKETSRYLKYIFNGHIAVAMLFFISALAYYYQQWLQDLPEDFPTAWIIAVAFGFMASYSPVRTLLKEPDLVFLLPAEYQLGDYFKRCLIYSYVVQLYVIFVLSAALGPLYFASYPELGTQYYLMMIGIVLIIKVWNMMSNWWMLKERNPRARLIDQLVKAVLNIAIFYFLSQGEWIFASIVTVLLVAVVLYTYSVSKQKAGLVWDLLVEKDQQRMRTFYRIANMFTDVPHLKNTVKKRHTLVRILVEGIPYRQDKTFSYLYKITFIRSSDYLGMYIRLIVIGGLAIWFVSNLWVKVIFAILFLYLSAFQMMTLWNHHRTIAWLDLYPVKKEWKQKAILQWLQQIILFQTFLFGLLFLFQWNLVGLVFVWMGGSLFSYLFIQTYVKKKLT